MLVNTLQTLFNIFSYIWSAYLELAGEYLCETFIRSCYTLMGAEWVAGSPSLYNNAFPRRPFYSNGKISSQCEQKRFPVLVTQVLSMQVKIASKIIIPFTISDLYFFFEMRNCYINIPEHPQFQKLSILSNFIQKKVILYSIAFV